MTSKNGKWKVFISREEGLFGTSLDTPFVKLSIPVHVGKECIRICLYILFWINHIHAYQVYRLVFCPLEITLQNKVYHKIYL